MVFLFPRRLRDKLWPDALPPLGSFEGQTVLITGATSGLGLAASVHFAQLGAKVIITSRSLSAGDVARERIEQSAEIVGQGKVQIMELDLSRYSSCVSFIDRLKHSQTGRMGIDVAVLNAGVINVDYSQSPEGWEQTIQINTLSTTLLGLLLLDWMKHQDRRKPPHLLFVTSRDHIDTDITAWAGITSQKGSLLQYLSDKQNWRSGTLSPNYAESKLMLTYAVEKLCEKAVGPDGKIDVVINPVCPGLVSTNLGRFIRNMSTLMQVLVPIHLSTLGKSADFGARTYVKAAQASPDEHGRYIQSLFTDDEYQSLKFPNLMSETAVQVKKLAWDEIITELTDKVPALRELDIET